MNSFADLGSDEEAGDAYMLDHANAGIDGLQDKERADVLALSKAYRAHFHFPLIVCAREVERYDRVLSIAGTAWRTRRRGAGERPDRNRENRQLPLDELVANANPIASAQLGRFAYAA